MLPDVELPYLCQMKEKEVPQVVEITVPHEEMATPRQWQLRAAMSAGYAPGEVKAFKILRRSIDARKRPPVYRLRIALDLGSGFEQEPVFSHSFQHVHEAEPVIIVGAGPAGYFAALELLELGFKPVIFERGKDVQARRRDLRAIQQFSRVNPDSNYCFGEGGAGTYSDGKLYTRSHKRGNIYKVLKLLVEHGAAEDILIDAHPHIGSNRLPRVVANIRQTILHYGGEVHFNARVTDLLIHRGHLQGIRLQNGEAYQAKAVLLATGHSAEDIYFMLHRLGLVMEAKPFAIGVRVEHPQKLIDKIQYGCENRPATLPASSYRLTTQVDRHGVFSFCMCPGGLIVPAATAPGEIVLNGMSMSRRDSPFANSGIVVSVDERDFKAFAKQGIFAGLAFRQMIERGLFAHGDGTQKAPAQKMKDFIRERLSANTGPSSYIPGVYAAPLHNLLPKDLYKRLQRGMKNFGRKMPGFLSEESLVLAPETRTSAPLRIPRKPDTLMHPQLEGLFPCGEGAGYAGGIISAAMDGQRVARAAAHMLAKA